MALYQVGRPAVREAMQNLQRMGLVQIRHGERPRVAMPSLTRAVAELREPINHLLLHSEGSLEHLKDARLLFEIGDGPDRRAVAHAQRTWRSSAQALEEQARGAAALARVHSARRPLSPRDRLRQRQPDLRRPSAKRCSGGWRASTSTWCRARATRASRCRSTARSWARSRPGTRRAPPPRCAPTSTAPTRSTASPSSSARATTQPE